MQYENMIGLIGTLKQIEKIDEVTACAATAAACYSLAIGTGYPSGNEFIKFFVALSPTLLAATSAVGLQVFNFPNSFSMVSFIPCRNSGVNGS